MKPFRVLFFVPELSPVSGDSPLALAASFLCRELGASYLDLTVVAPRANDRDPEQFGYARRLEPIVVPGGEEPSLELTLFEGMLPSGEGRVFVLDTPDHATALRAGLDLARQRDLWPHVVHAGRGADGAAAALAAFEGGDLPMPALVTSSELDIPPGIDEARWQTAPDPVARKPEAKLELQRAWGLPPRAKTPLVAVLGPACSLASADGSAAELTGLDAQLALLADREADRELVTRLRDLASRNPTRVATRVAEDDSSVRAVLEAADLVLLPSPHPTDAFSPLYCVHFGAAPIAPNQGDFSKLLVDFDPRSGTGNGFLFAPDSASGAAAATRRAVRAYHQGPKQFEILARRLASMDVSWTTAALRHLELYRKA